MTNQRKRIYIAGPMTGLPNYNRKAFIAAAIHIATKTNPVSYTHLDVYKRQIATIETVALLVLDDLGAERETSFAEEQLFAIIDRRLLSSKPTIVTTNLTFQERTSTGLLLRT